jgi:pimeloyl-ACP methyl ester carboxylesterase
MDLHKITLGNKENQSLIIIHGLFGLSDNWYSIGKKLAENYFVIIPDMRNHGKSPDSESFGIEEMASDLKELISQNELEKPIILGHSMGGKIAMHFALNQPESISSLIVVDMHTRESELRDEHFKIADCIKNTKLENFKSYSEISKHLEKEIGNKKIAQLMLKNIGKVSNNYKWKLNIENIEKNFQNITKSIETENSFYEASLFIKGGDSNYILESDKPLIEALFPYSEIVKIPGASHWVHADKTEEFMDIISDFLKKYKL